MRDQVFISYSHQDRGWLNEFNKFFKPYQRNLPISCWDDTQIQAGAKWKAEIGAALRRSRAAVLLVTADFTSSDFISNNELPPLLEAAENRDLKIFWIAVSSSPYEETPLSAYQALNDPAKPLDTLTKPEVAREMVEICKRLVKIMESAAPIPDAIPSPAPVASHTAASVAAEQPHQLTSGEGSHVVLLYKRVDPDELVMKLIENHLTANGFSVFVDRDMTIGLEWAQEIERQLREADAVIPLLSQCSVHSEMLAYELQVAHRAAQSNKGRPAILPVRVKYTEALPGPIDTMLYPLQYAVWKGPEDNICLVSGILNALRVPKTRLPAALQTPGGGMPPYSEFYIQRETDREFQSAVLRQDSIVVVKGPRQMGKTSLLARGLQSARDLSARTVVTDFQRFTEDQLKSLDTLLFALAETIAERLELPNDPEWNPKKSSLSNFERFLRRQVLAPGTLPLVWAMDEVDVLFAYRYCSEFFGIIRTWHNERATVPDTPWARLTVAMALATEAHLFIRNLNQSPFNVGTRLTLQDFTPKEVRQLHERYGAPLSDQGLDEFYRLVGGQPYLVNRGLFELRTHPEKVGGFMATADRDDGPFGDHLRRIVVLLAADDELRQAVTTFLTPVTGNGIPSKPVPIGENAFLRLRSAGLLAGEGPGDARARCELYVRYLCRHFGVAKAQTT